MRGSTRRTDGGVSGTPVATNGDQPPAGGNPEPDPSGKPDPSGTGDTPEPNTRTFGDLEPAFAVATEPAVRIIEPGASEFSAGTRTRKPRSDAGIPRGNRAVAASRETAPGESNITTLQVTDLIGLLHMGLAKLFAGPEFSDISDGETKKVADAFANTAKQYAVMVDPKKMAIYTLFMTLFTVYVSRCIAYSKRIARERRKEARVLTPTATDRQTPAARPQPRQAGPQPIEELMRSNGKGFAPFAPSDINPAPAENFPGLG